MSRSSRPARLAALLVGVLLSAAVLPAGAGTLVRMHTSAGDLLLHLADDRAPATVANFLAHVDLHGYEDGAFYRVVTPDNQPQSPVRIEVIQGGLGFDAPDVLAPIVHETTEDTGLRHRNGTLSMARGEPGTASSEFFVCIGAQPELDFGGARNPDGLGFAAFGEVVEGMDVVRAIQRRGTRSVPDGGDPFLGQFLVEPVRILGVRRLGTLP